MVERRLRVAVDAFVTATRHIGVPACMSLSTCLAQNMEFVAVKREVKSGMYRLSPPCAEKVFFSRHRSQLSSASTKRYLSPSR